MIEKEITSKHPLRLSPLHITQDIGPFYDMSGIVGILNDDSQPIDPNLLHQMTESMAPQGPDGRGTWYDGHVGFGHALLRTTWESYRERQPHHLDGQFYITGDIRLDRRDALIDQLCAARRYIEKDATDVDLVLHAYRVWGDACLERFSGDFAFGIWDKSRQRLFCARDQFGITPLYYAEIGKGLIFSNHLNCLRLHPQISDDLNEEAIGDFLLFNMNLENATTTFVDIRKLPPGHALMVSETGVQVRRYWQLPQAVDVLNYRRPEAYVEQFRELFDQAVADRLRTDRAGSHLSGGMDSTSIAATAYRHLSATHSAVDFRAYTIVYRQLLHDDEGDYAKQVAETAGFPLEYLVAEDYMGQAPAANPAYISPEPLMIPNQVAEVDITQRIAGYSRVLLAGFGGDPALYPSPSQRYAPPQNGWLQHGVNGILGSMRSLRRLSRSAWRTLVHRQSHEMDIPDWLDHDFTERTQLRARLQHRLTTPLRTDRYGMATAPLWSNIFAGSDPGFSGFPVKVRFPFFDLHLVRFLLSVPPGPWFEQKFLLREAMQGVLPETVRQRSKTPLRGFAHFNWIQQQGPQPWMAELTATPALAPYIRSDYLSQSLEALVKFTPVGYHQLIPVFHLAYWLRYQSIQ